MNGIDIECRVVLTCREKSCGVREEFYSYDGEEECWDSVAASSWSGNHHDGFFCPKHETAEQDG